MKNTQDMNNLFSQRLKELRKKKNMTQKELADRLNVSSSTIGMYEQNRRMPDSTTLSEICNIFDVSSDYLLGRIPEKSTEALDVISDLTQKLENRQGLMYNGKPMNKEDISKLVGAIKIAGEIALRHSQEKDG